MKKFIGDKFLKKETTLSNKTKEQVNAMHADAQFDPLGSYTGGTIENGVFEAPTQDADDL